MFLDRIQNIGDVVGNRTCITTANIYPPTVGEIWQDRAGVLITACDMGVAPKVFVRLHPRYAAANNETTIGTGITLGTLGFTYVLTSGQTVAIPAGPDVNVVLKTDTGQMNVEVRQYK